MTRALLIASLTAASLAHAGGISVELAAVTLTDPCNVKSEAVEEHAKAKRAAKADMARSCDESSLQLAITAAEAGELKLKSIELSDDKGGTYPPITPRAPNAWIDGKYQPWDGKVAAGQKLNVSYPMASPDLGPGRHGKLYTVKVTVTINGADQSVSKQVQLRRETTLPPNVKT